MRSAQRGNPISDVEVTNVSAHGFWLLLGNRELFVAFEQFLWFEDASVRQILDVELQGPDHLYWPELDIDLSVESIEDPGRFPLVSRAGVAKRVQQARGGRRPQAGRRAVRN